METDSIYAYRLQDIRNPTFEKVRDLAEKIIDPLRPSIINNIYEQLNRGVDMLETEPQMLVYLYAFGNMHQAKLNRALSEIPGDFFNLPEINIIDYGCGQTIGTMCYADYLVCSRSKQNVRSVTLIEPSKVCLDRAALHTSIVLPDAEIHAVCKTFDQLTANDLPTNECDITLHILSNVLDIQSFDLERFANLIRDNIHGYNLFLCVGPYFGYSEKDKRMSQFANAFSGTILYNQCFNKGELIEFKDWTAQILCFEVGEKTVTNGEVVTEIEDEFGVVYSRDGEHLLYSMRADIEEYKIKNGTKVIGKNAFKRRESLHKISIPCSVTTIDEGAFWECKSLKQIIIPNSVTSIGEGVFCGCESLRQITIPNSVTKIEDITFSWCKSLQQITIPDSVNTIGEEAFDWCHSLEKIIIPQGTTEKFKGMLSEDLWDKLTEI